MTKALSFNASGAIVEINFKTGADYDADATATPNTIALRNANGDLFARSINLGDAVYSPSAGINGAYTYGADQNGYGCICSVNNTDETLTADRSLIGGQLIAESRVQGAEAFGVASYGVMGIARTGAAEGGYSVTGEGNFHGGNFEALYRSTDAAYKYAQSLTGARGAATLNTAAAAVIANAYALFGAVRNLIAGATITNGYGLYLAHTSTGDITNKWSIYSNGSAWIGYHAGSMRFGGSATQSPRGVVDVVGSLYFDSIALGPDAVNIDTITANGHITNVTTNTTGTFNLLQPKTGVIVTYSDGTVRTQLHYANTGIWFRRKNGAAAYTDWDLVVSTENTGLSRGSCSFNGSAGILILRNTASLSISRTGVGTYQLNTIFGMQDHLPVVAMTNGARVILNTRAGSSGLILATYGYNNATLADSSYVCVILGN